MARDKAERATYKENAIFHSKWEDNTNKNMETHILSKLEVKQIQRS